MTLRHHRGPHVGLYDDATGATGATGGGTGGASDTQTKDVSGTYQDENPDSPIVAGPGDSKATGGTGTTDSTDSTDSTDGGSAVQSSGEGPTEGGGSGETAEKVTAEHAAPAVTKSDDAGSGGSSGGPPKQEDKASSSDATGATGGGSGTAVS